MPAGVAPAAEAAPDAPETPDAPVEATGNDGDIALGDIAINRYNRAYGQKLNEHRVKKLARSIKKNGLIQRVVLVRATGKAGKYEIVVGAHRVAAKRELDGKSGVLKPDEYRILEGVDPNDMKCLEVSIAENRDRQGLSPYEMATYIVRLVEEKGMTQQKVGDLLGIDRVVVNPLCKLPEYYERLPKAWKRDLAWDGDGDDESNASYTPAITLTHWRVVEPAIIKQGVTPAIKKALAAAAKESWPVSRLVQEIRPGKKTPKAKSNDDIAPPVDGQTKDAREDATSPPHVPSGPNYEGILQTLDNAKELAADDRAVRGVIEIAISGVKALRPRQASTLPNTSLEDKVA
jgi:ParB/RepB/Spo0J family partition protein